MKITRLALALAVPVALASGVAACGTDTTAAPIKIGVTDGARPFWTVYKDLAKEQGINVEIRNFDDYQAPNAALNDGDVQINEYQHLLFLAAYNKQNKTELTPIGSTGLYPTALYSKKHRTLAEIPQGGTVVIPNDQTNQARSLALLSSAGLVKFRTDPSPIVSIADVDKAASKVNVRAVRPNETVVGIDNVSGAIVDPATAAAAKLGAEQVLAKEDPGTATAAPYVNVFVVRKDDAKNDTYLRLAKLYHDQKVTTAARSDVGDAFTVVDKPATELQQTLTTVQRQLAQARPS
ncbi:methionine ABC transporter substrate-binding protein [Tsukamurella pulmonis]|uniref:D-methionine transport system substrate-binding protein n=1 Tax=Tsukamurella pulmonis TaxID=47312 RepID=A0A1H1A8A5_9ACTN|nr:MetQ/NlpA family ABC transporter substrate-binding protein [Tsukamurella pulmonis]KXO95803.1 methionine ABC transporter substrate-binding protein [Tsukamurella pulmonis]SDQ35945.1 D-methionine transport system substrate-binding protein [Tsukamurella pulmonis]SUQ39434.1 29 kDa protein [Tsukamurella pulmonis]